jgi:hypothetical protein
LRQLCSRDPNNHQSYVICYHLASCTATSMPQLNVRFVLQAAAKDDRRLWQQRLHRMEHELQANKLHIQSLMQQLHAIAAKQALGGSEAAADDTAAQPAATGAQEAGPSAAGTDQQQNSSSARAVELDATHEGAAATSSLAGSGGSCSSGGSASTPVRSFDCQGVASPSRSSEATSKCRPACSSFTRGGCMFHSTAAALTDAAQPLNSCNARTVRRAVPQT